jgi:hypothetical protein
MMLEDSQDRSSLSERQQTVLGVLGVGVQARNPLILLHALPIIPKTIIPHWFIKNRTMVVDDALPSQNNEKLSKNIDSKLTIKVLGRQRTFKFVLLRIFVSSNQNEMVIW